MYLQMFFAFQLILFLSAFSGGADGYYNSRLTECLFSSSDLTDLAFVDNYIFNKDMLLQFNSTVGEFVGYTELGVKNAQRANSDPNILQQWRAELERYCRVNAEADYSSILEKTVKPRVKLSSVKPAGDKHPAVLMCTAYNFYPKRIKMTWLRNNKPVTSDVTSTEELDNGNWYYQIHSHLHYTPKSGEKISCMVEHSSFNKPMIYDWDLSLSEADRNKIVIGVSGLVLGIIIAIAGLIYYKKKSTGGILAPC